MEDVGGAEPTPAAVPLAEAVSVWLAVRYWSDRAHRAEVALARVTAERDELQRRWDQLLAGYPTR